MFLDFKFYYKAIMINRVWYWRRSGPREQWKKKKESRNTLTCIW